MKRCYTVGKNHEKSYQKIFKVLKRAVSLQRNFKNFLDEKLPSFTELRSLLLGGFCSLCSRVARDVRLLKCSKVTSKFFWNAPNELVRKLCSSHHQQDKPKQKCGMGHADLLHVLLHFLHPNSNSMERPRGLTVLYPNSGTISKN